MLRHESARLLMQTMFRESTATSALQGQVLSDAEGPGKGEAFEERRRGLFLSHSFCSSVTGTSCTATAAGTTVGVKLYAFGLQSMRRCRQRLMAGDRRSGRLCLASSRWWQARHMASGWAHGAHFRRYISFACGSSKQPLKAERESTICNIYILHNSWACAGAGDGGGWGPQGRLPAPGQLCYESLQIARYQAGQHFLPHEVALPSLPVFA